MLAWNKVPFDYSLMAYTSDEEIHFSDGRTKISSPRTIEYIAPSVSEPIVIDDTVFENVVE